MNWRRGAAAKKLAGQTKTKDPSDLAGLAFANA
jgi:hypothetical protein